MKKRNKITKKGVDELYEKLGLKTKKNRMEAQELLKLANSNDDNNNYWILSSGNSKFNDLKEVKDNG